MAKDNRTLGRFHLVGIPPAPRGVPQIEVTFDIDANGIVNVSAKDLGTGKEQAITITASSGISEDEIKRMIKEAESHAEEDKRKRQEIEQRNQLDGLIYTVEKTLQENKDKLSTAEVQPLEEAIREAKDALQSQNPSRIQKANERLTQASHKLAEVMYQKVKSGKDQTASSPSGTSASSSPEEGEVVDAEYEDPASRK